MTAALDALRARHEARPGYGEPPDAPAFVYCTFDGVDWPCDAAQLLAALDRAEAVVAAARKVPPAWSAYIEAVAGRGHPDESHDDELHAALTNPGDPCIGHEHCARCGGAEYGTEDALRQAVAALADVAGEER